MTTDLGTDGLIAANAVALTTDTTGNYVAAVTTSVLTGLTGGNVAAEGTTSALAFDYSQALSGDVGLGANATVFGVTGLVAEGATADTIELFLAIPDPVTTDKTLTLPNETGTLCSTGSVCTGYQAGALTGDVTTVGAAATIAANAVALGTDTTNAYVADLAAGTAIDVSGGGAETATVTVDVDTTELEAFTLGAGGNASNVLTFNLSGTDPTLTAGSALITIGGALTSTGTITGVAGTFSGLVTGNANVTIGNGATGPGALRFLEDTDSGANYLEFIAPTAITSNSTCTLENDGNPIPDSCVGDGTDAGGTDTNADKEFVWPASSAWPLEPADSIPPLAKDAGTNVDMLVADFDQSTDECRTVAFLAPPDITSGGTVTFSAYWYSASVTTNNVVWDFRHNSGTAEGVDPDQADTVEAAAADAVQGTAGQKTITTWTETQTNLGWVASDLVLGEFCRDADNVSDTFAADARAVIFAVRIPRS